MTQTAVRPAQAAAAASASSADRGKAWLPSLSGIRWWAAIAVIIHHTLTGILGTGYIKIVGMETLASAGYLAVTLFFVLSGFILTWSWRETWTKKSFYANRFARIYPLYLLMVPVYFYFVDHVLSGRAPHPQIGPTIAEIGLVHALWPYQNFYGAQSLVTWSLSCEAVFYALLPLLLKRIWDASNRVIATVFVAAASWVVILPLIVDHTVHDQHLARGFELNPCFSGAQFVMGVCAGLAFRRGWRPVWNPWVVTSFLLAQFVVCSDELKHFIVTPTSIESSRFYAHMLFTPVALMTVVALASADLRGVRTPVSGKATVLFGNWSYSIYLSHVVALYYIADLWRHLGIRQVQVQLGMILVGCLIIGGALHYLVERPFSRWVRVWLERGQVPATAAAAGTPVG